VFAAVRAQPPEWLGEFSAWVAANLGPRPSQITRRRAAEEHDAAVMGALLAWGYFDGVIAEMAADEESDKELVRRIRDEELAAAGEEPPPVPEEPTPNLVAVPRRPFSVLGADGQPVVEGLTTWEEK
jgi:hypothetical protein